MSQLIDWVARVVKSVSKLRGRVWIVPLEDLVVTLALVGSCHQGWDLVIRQDFNLSYTKTH